jgi:cytochrome c2
MRAPGEISMSESDMDMDGEGDEREELTTKGRKRKRLAKACSACHVAHILPSRFEPELIGIVME